LTGEDSIKVVRQTYNPDIGADIRLAIVPTPDPDRIGIPCKGDALPGASRFSDHLVMLKFREFHGHLTSMELR
jgi:hypothetical protein